MTKAKPIPPVRRSPTVVGKHEDRVPLFDRRPVTIGGFRLAGRSIRPVGKPTITGWQEALVFAEETEQSSPYWVGGLIEYGENRDDWRAKLVQAMSVTGLSRQTLLNRASIYRRSTDETRALAPSPGHLDVVLGLPPAEQREWLDKARREEIPVRHLRTQIRAASQRTVIEGQAVLPTRAFDVEVTVALTVDAETSYAASERAESEIKACLKGSKARVLFAWVVSE